MHHNRVFFKIYFTYYLSTIQDRSFTFYVQKHDLLVFVIDKVSYDLNLIRIIQYNHHDAVVSSISKHSDAVKLLKCTRSRQ